MTTAEPDRQPLKVVTLVYPGATPMDFLGPAMALNFFGEVHFYWKNLDPIFCDFIEVLPNATFGDLPEHFDVLLVPGGGGQLAPMNDDEVLGFIQECGRRADYITSVCTGSLILAMAGLLNGYKAATHWTATDILADLGAIPVESRVVEDRNRITGGGITAGIDFGLALLAKLRGPEAAKTAQLIMEYDPAPPFDAGSPAAAGPELTNRVRTLVSAGNEKIRRLIAERKSRTA